MPTSPTPPTRHWDAPAPGHDPTRHWGTSPTPPGPKRKRRGPILLAAAIGVALLVAAGFVANGATLDNGPAPTPTTTPSPGPADPPDDGPGGGSEVPEPAPTPEPEPEPEPEPATVEVPELSGITRAGAEQILADYGLKATVRYRSTDQYPARSVISQSPKAGALVLPDTTISLVVAKTPPPPASAPEPPSPPSPPAPNCDPSYPDVCLDPAVEDYDCAGGTGNGPEYVEGPIRVRPPDPFDLDGTATAGAARTGNSRSSVAINQQDHTGRVGGRMLTPCSRDMPTPAGTARGDCPWGFPEAQSMD
jgi:hypothetical protein